MIRWMRISGFALMALGVLTIVGYFVEPLRHYWRVLLELPIPILVGLTAGSLGFLMLFSSLLYERWESRDADRALRDDD